MKKLILTSLFLATAFGFTQVQAQQAEANPLDALLQKVKSNVSTENRFNKKREQEFRNRRNEQRQLLAQARKELAAENARSDRLKSEYDQNEKSLANLETVLQERQGNLGEMFGVVRQVAGDAKSQFDNSIASSQLTGRSEFLSNLAQSKALPSIEQLRQLWFELQREITEQSKVVQYSTEVMRKDGRIEQNVEVTRVGVFNAISGGQFLQWNSEQIGRDEGILVELPRQPDARFREKAAELETASSGYMGFPADPTSGVILSLVVQAPSAEERVRQGKEIGYAIILVGIFGLILVVYRFVMLSLISMKMKSQLKNETPNGNNPLGRVLQVYADNPDVDVDTLELKLDEAIMRESPALESGLSIIKIIYVVAPLLGLLGTVTGMIETFQQITLFGTGDPKMMAGGISAALVTTMLGLFVAIPMTFLHSVLQSKSRSLLHILEEQSAGIVATIAEKHDAGVN